MVRNGYHQQREVPTAAGVVEVKALQVNDRRIDEVTGERKRFSSAILPARGEVERARADGCACGRHQGAEYSSPRSR